MKKSITLWLALVFSFQLSAQSQQRITKDSVPVQEDYVEKITFNLGAGVFIPKGQLQRYFGTGPVLEFNFNFPINNTKSIDLVGQFVIPNQVENFTYIRTIDTIQAKSQLMFNIFVKLNKSLKTTEKSELKAFLGLGASTITTNARNPFYSGAEGESKYEFISALLITPGIDYTFRISQKSKLVVGINYQYSPYKLEGALQENIGSSAIITKLQFRF